MMPRWTPISLQRRSTVSASQPGKCTLRIDFASRVIGRSPRDDRRLRSFVIAARSLKAREKSTERTSRKPSVFKFGADWSAVEPKGKAAQRGLKAVTVGLTPEEGKVSNEQQTFRTIGRFKIRTKIYESPRCIVRDCLHLAPSFFLEI